MNAKQNKTKQNKTKQNKIKQNEIKQNKTYYYKKKKKKKNRERVSHLHCPARILNDSRSEERQLLTQHHRPLLRAQQLTHKRREALGGEEECHRRLFIQNQEHLRGRGCTCLCVFVADEVGALGWCFVIFNDL